MPPARRWRRLPLRTRRRSPTLRVCGGGTALPKGPEPGWRRFSALRWRRICSRRLSRRCRSLASGLARASRRRGGRRFFRPARWAFPVRDVCPVCDAGATGGKSPRPRAAPDFAQTAASSRHCGRPSAPCCGPAAAQAAVRRPHPGRDAVRIWLRRSGPVSAPGCGRDAVRPAARVSAPGRPCAGHIPEPVPRWGS